MDHNFIATPRHIRDMTNVSVDEFKRSLDNYLVSIPDQPQIVGYTARRQADTNSVVHMKAHAVAAHISPQELHLSEGELYDQQA